MVDDNDDSLLDLAGFARSMPSFVLGEVPARVIDLTRGVATRAVAVLPVPRRSHQVVIPEPCQQFVDGLDSYGQEA